jgi:DNA-binding NtrC family response regulator
MGFKSSRSATSRSAAPKAAAKKPPKPAAANPEKKAKTEPVTTATDIEPLRETIRRAIVNALERSRSLRDAARALGMPYSSLRDKLYQLGIDVPERSNSRQRADEVLAVVASPIPAKPKRGASKKSKKK